jgi:hypothetical protein
MLVPDAPTARLSGQPLKVGQALQDILGSKRIFLQ